MKFFSVFFMSSVEKVHLDLSGFTFYCESVLDSVIFIATASSFTP